MKTAEALASAALIALIYYGYQLGLAERLVLQPRIHVTYWPAPGIVFGILLLTQQARWPLWLTLAGLAELVAHAIWREPFMAALLQLTGNLAAAAGGALFLRARIAAPLHFRSIRETLFFVATACVAPAISASFATLASLMAPATHGPLETWSMVWLETMSAVLTVTPLMLIASTMWTAAKGTSLRQAIEPAALILGAVAILLISSFTWQQLAYVSLPLMVWLAFRAKLRGVAVAMAALCLASGVIVASKLGVFAPELGQFQLRFALALVFLGIVASVSLLVAALAQSYQDTMGRLRDANNQLEAHLAEGTENLRESETTLQMALEAAEAGTWSVDERRQRAVWDERFRRIHGIADDAPVNAETWLAAIHPADQPALRAQMDQLRDSPGSDEWRAEYRVHQPEGEERWILSTGKAKYRHGGAMTRLTGICIDITFRKSQEDRLRLLVRESSHRKRNMLAVVMAVARHTVADQPEDFLQRFQARMQSLATNYDLLINNAWQGVDLRKMTLLQLAHFGDLIGKQIIIEGPDLRINATAAQPLGLALHELATNASKYGSLSTNAGLVRIEWQIDKPSPDPATWMFHLAWDESRGPLVTPPKHCGFGTQVTEKMIQISLSATVSRRFLKSGLKWEISVPAGEILDASSGLLKKPA